MIAYSVRHNTVGKCCNKAMMQWELVTGKLHIGFMLERGEYSCFQVVTFLGILRYITVTVLTLPKNN